MAWFTPEPHPDEKYYIFGDNFAVDAMARAYDVPVLAEIPLVASVGDHNDAGSPVALDPTNPMAHAFAHLAHVVVDAVDRRNDTLPPTVKVDISGK